MEFLIGLVALWIAWLISSKRWRRWLRFPLIGLAMGLIILSPVGFRLMLLGLTVPLPKDSGGQVDAIIVLGRGPEMRDLRVSAVQELWQAKRASRVFASGMLDARLMVEALQDLGLPGISLTGEECSQSTYENGLFSAALLRPQKVEKILLVTDAPHMLRSVLTFRSFGFQVVPASASLPPPNLPGSLPLLREYLALASYGITGKFNMQPLDNTLIPISQLTSRIQDWNCHMKGR